MNTLVFDLETACSKEDFKREPKTPLDPINGGFIISVGCTVDGVPHVFLGLDERKLLSEFWAFVNQNEVGRFVGFNNSTFDNHFLFWRTCVNDIPAGFCFNEWNKSIDLRPFLLKLQPRLYGQQVFTKGKLVELAGKLGCDVGDIDVQLDGSCMQEMYEAGNWGKIEQHQREDVVLSWRVFQKVKFWLPLVKKGW